MKQINTYLTFNGECKAAFEFYRSVFGGEFGAISTFADMPADAGMEISEEDKDRVLHVSLPVGNTTLMGSDTPSSTHDVTKGDSVSVSCHPESEEESKRVFDALAEGGTVVMPLEKAFWNALFGMCVDRFGIHWMVNYDYGQEK